MSKRNIPKHKNIALVAHDHKKAELVEWVKRHRPLLEGHNLICTGTTGRLIEEALGQPVKRYESGPLGGDMQIGSDIVEGKIHLLVFFWDPLEAQPHDPDVRALLRICVVWNIPLACTPATADYLITSHLFGEAYDQTSLDYEAYRARKLKN